MNDARVVVYWCDDRVQICRGREMFELDTNEVLVVISELREAYRQQSKNMGEAPKHGDSDGE